MDDLKNAIIYYVRKSKAESSIELFSELLQLLYANGFSDGQRYARERDTEDGLKHYDDGSTEP